MSRITLWGFYKFTGETLFDDAPLPEAINKKDLVDLIMIECGDLYPYYQHPGYLQMQITNFFKRKKDAFEKMCAVLAAEYDPLENYDKKEDWSDVFDERVKGEAHDETKDKSKGSNLNKISAMDSDNLVNDTSSATESEGESNATTKNTAERDNKNVHAGRVHGNIGVTTSMALVKEELALRKYDIMEEIVRMFEKDVIIQIY